MGEDELLEIFRLQIHDFFVFVWFSYLWNKQEETKRPSGAKILVCQQKKKGANVAETEQARPGNLL